MTLNGENFDIKVEHGVETLGFYVIRVVQAGSVEQAEIKAIELLKSEPELTEITVNALNNPPMIYIDEVNLLPESHGAVNTGYSFYSDDTK